MKIGIIGLGSIGTRHIRCLKQLGYKDIIALRTKKGTIKELVEDLNYVIEVYTPEEFYSMNPNGVIISNPTSLHVDSMKIPLQKKIPIFIEKPIALSLEQIREIINNDLSNVMVGYCLRYSKLIGIVKKYLDSGNLGKIYKANLYFGEYLPSWHPYSDYRKEYYSLKELGGGAIRTLSHDIDLMHYLFGEVEELVAIVDKISDLNIDVDDNVYISCKMLNNILVKIELDYLNPIRTRKGTIFGSKGVLEYSFLNHTVSYINLQGKIKTIYENLNYDPNKMYIEQMKSFINFIKNRKSFLCSFEDGINVMKIIKAAEESSKTKFWQNIGDVKL